MGNINEKNAPDDGEKDPRHVLLNPKGHFDPWTDKNEARAIEAVLFPGIEPRYPSSPSPKPPPRSKQTSTLPAVKITDLPRQDFLDVVCLSTSIILDSENEATSEDLDTPQTDIPDPTEPDNDHEESGDTSLSDSVIPATFETVEKAETLPSDIEINISTPLTNGIRSLDTIEELNEDTSLTNPESQVVDDPLLLTSGKPPQPHRTDCDNGASETTVLRPPATPDRATTITELVLEKSPLALASNNPRVTLQQNLDIPIAPLPLSVLGEKDCEAAMVLSPLTLGPSTLTHVDDVELKELVDIYCEDTEKKNCKDDETSRPPEVYQEGQLGYQNDGKNNANFLDIKLSEDSHVAPPAPYLDTIPLPPFPTEESAGLFVSEVLTLEDSGLGSIVPKPVNAMDPDQARISASPMPVHLPGAAVESKEIKTPIQSRDVMIQAPSIVSGLGEIVHGGSSESSLESKAPHPAVLQTHLSVGIQASAAEDDIESLQAAIDTLKIDSPNNDIPSFPPRPTAQHSELVALAQGAQEAQKEGVQIVTPENSSQKLALVIPELRTYADATNIAIRHPELAKEVLKAPLASSHSSSTIDRFTRKVEERESTEHTPDRPNWAKAPVEGDAIPTLTGPTLASDALKGSVHTPGIPNWAVAPVLESTVIPKGGRTQRERGPRRGKKAKKNQSNHGGAESSWPIPGPSTLLEPTPLLVSEPEKELFEHLCKSTPPLQFVPTEEQRKVAANRRKVSKWISESTSVMASPKSNAKRGSIAVASCSTFMMESVSEQVIEGGLGTGGDVSFENAPSPASRMAKALAAREAFKRGLSDQVVENDQHLKTRTSDPAPMTTPNEPMEDNSPCQDDRKITVDKGKNPMVRSPSPVSRPRSASIASSLASGVSAKSGVSTLSRLFQRAIQEMGSQACSRPISGTHNGGTRPIPPEGRDKEPQGTPNAVAQPPEPLSRGSPEIDNTTPIVINAVTCPEIAVTQATKGAAPNMKGKFKISAPPHQMVEPSRSAGSNGERFIFSFKPPQASIGKEDQKTPVGSQQIVPPFTTQLGATAVPPPRFEQRGNTTKTPRAPSTRNFIPRGKYVPPPIRDGQIYRQSQASVTSTAVPSASAGNGTPTSQTQKTPQASQLSAGTGATMTATAGLNVHAPPFDLYDDALMDFQAPVPARTNVIPDVNAHIGTAGDLPDGTQRDPHGRPKVFGHRRQPNSTSASHAPAAHMNPSIRFRAHDTMTPLGFPSTVHTQPQGFFDPQAQVQAQAQIPKYKLDEYMVNLAMAQERLQQNMADLVHLASGYGKPETFNPTVTTSQFQSSNLRARGNRPSFGPIPMEETRTFLQSPICQQGPPMGPRVSLPSRFQPQAPAPFAAQHMFEEYCRRQRQETRTMHENIPSRLPRRKI